MAAHSIPAIANPTSELKLEQIAIFPGLRALAWHGDVLFASRGYRLLRARIGQQASIRWEHAAEYRPPLWRQFSSRPRLACRFFRDGFHALAILSSGDLIGAVPGAIVRLPVGDDEFHICRRVLRGTRPLHFAVAPGDRIFWGEYFDNRKRDEVHIYASSDRGAHWDAVYTFPAGSIRHVHNIVYDRWDNCLWILTGDEGAECRILRASCDFRNVGVIFSGSQQTRAAALVPMGDAIYFSTDTPVERNYIRRHDRKGSLDRVAELASSSIYGCKVGNSIFFSTMVEPSAANLSRDVWLFGSGDGLRWQNLLHWKKDRWPMRLFQYGNAFLPDGENATGLLAVATVGVEGADSETGVWRVL